MVIDAGVQNRHGFAVAVENIDDRRDQMRGIADDRLAGLDINFRAVAVAKMLD